jgi:hypothetical protein
VVRPHEAQAQQVQKAKHALIGRRHVIQWVLQPAVGIGSVAGVAYLVYLLLLQVEVTSDNRKGQIHLYKQLDNGPGCIKMPVF